MQLNKELTKVIADERLEQSEKDQKIADLKRKIEEIASLAEMLPRLSLAADLDRVLVK